MTENFRGRKGIIIGGGASGLMAAITAAEQGAVVTVIEHTARPGKKILSTGNGKCNLTNLYMDPSFYRSDEKGFWGTAIRNFPPKAAVAFFRNLGVLTMDRGGYVMQPNRSGIQANNYARHSIGYVVRGKKCIYYMPAKSRSAGEPPSCEPL